MLLAAFAVTYRYTVWLQRPPTRLFWSAGWQLLFRADTRRGNLAFLLRALSAGLFAQKFIRRRSSTRWFAHLCFAWGTLIAVAVTFPLVFGWLHFETRPLDDRAGTAWWCWGNVVSEFHTRSLARYVMFNLLNLSAVMVIVGVSLALRRRLRDPGSRARQQFGNDIVPLLLLLAVSATGLMLTLSTHLLRGYGYAPLSLIHAFVVDGHAAVPAVRQALPRPPAAGTAGRGPLPAGQRGRPARRVPRCAARASRARCTWPT